MTHHVEQLARRAHEINRAYCAALGDYSQPEWEDAPDWQKESARVGVRMHLLNPSATPEDSHASWYAQKEAEGWKYGPVKDASKKEHPCFVPYAELPESQKAKDYLFRAVVHEGAMSAGQEAADAICALPVSVTLDALEAKFVDVKYLVPVENKLTICVITMANGFTVTGESACVDPAKFNKALGEQYAYEMARDKAWVAEGYLLQQRKFEAGL